MTERVRDYFATVERLFGAILASDGGGRPASRDDGVAAAVAVIAEASAAGGKLLLVGNGASASIASHMAVDFWKASGVRALAFNDGALLTCVSNDCGYAEVFERPVAMFGEAGDVLIAVSSSGRSENILRAVAAARAKGMRVITLSGFDEENPLRGLGDANFYVPSSVFGHVEAVHTAICHCFADMVAAAP